MTKTQRANFIERKQEKASGSTKRTIPCKRSVGVIHILFLKSMGCKKRRSQPEPSGERAEDAMAQ